MENKIIVNTDGGSRGNPGEAAYGFVISFQGALIVQEGKRIGVATNNTAEYQAILESLTWIASHRESIGEFSGITMRMDSLLACQQLKGIFRVKQPHLQEFLWKIRAKENEIAVPISYHHVRREFNKEADAMVNAALDNKI